jgi:prophage regulatory protein
MFVEGIRMAELPRRCLMRLPTVKGMTGIGHTSIYKKISEGTFPKPVRIGDRMVAWDSKEIDVWIEKQIAGVK